MINLLELIISVINYYFLKVLVKNIKKIVDIIKCYLINWVFYR